MKEKMMKKVSLTALSALFAVSLSVGIATLTDTTADGTEATILAGGAGVRVQYDEETQETDGKNGIRFATYLKNVEKSEIKSSVTAIMPTDLLDGATLTITTEGAQVEDTKDKWHAYTDDTHGEVLCAYAVLYDVPAASYSREISWVTQVTLEGETESADDDIVLTMTPASRSLASVAADAEANKVEEGFTAGQLSILEAYQNVAEAGTYAVYDENVVLSAETATVAVEGTPAFWSNYYKAYNTIALNITVAGDVADISELTYTPNGGTAVDIPLNLLTADETVSVPVDFAYGDFINGTFAATVANDTTVSVNLAKPTTVATQTTNAMYAYSREDAEMRLGFVNMLKNDEVTADQVLSVKYDGEYVDFTADTTCNNIVFASDILSAVEDGEVGASFEIRTATKKYTMTKPIAHTKVFYEADDLFVTYDNGTTYYSYFDMSEDDDRFEPLTEGTATTGLAAKGTYALGADIDLTEDSRVLWHADPAQGNSGSNFLNKGAGTYIGLTGTFTGYAHTITGMTVGRGGFFGHIGRGKVQHVSFKDVKYSTNENTNMDQYASVLAYHIGGNSSNVPSFDNIHISVASDQTGAYYTTKAQITSEVEQTAIYGYPSILSYTMSTGKAASFTNVVVDLSALGENVNVMGFGLFGGTSVQIPVTAYDNMTNVILISGGGLLISHDNKTTNSSFRLGVIYDAANQNSTASWAGTNVAFIAATAVYAVEESTVTFLKGTSLYRFNNASEMESYVTDNEVDISGFKTSGWDTWVPFLGAE